MWSTHSRRTVPINRSASENSATARPTERFGTQPHSRGSTPFELLPPRNRIIPCSNAVELSNNIMQKGLAFVRNWSGTVVNSEHQGRSEILPRRLHGRGGASVVRRDAAINRNGGSRCQSPPRSDHRGQYTR